MKALKTEDAEFVQLASQGDLRAFNKLVLEYQNQVFNLAFHLLRNADLSEDLTREAFLLAFRKIYQFRGGSLRAWLLKIMANLCYDELRTWKRTPFSPSSRFRNMVKQMSPRIGSEI